jgi:hypothetical protein
VVNPCGEVIFEDVVWAVDAGLVEGGGCSCNVFASVVSASVGLTSDVFTSDAFTSDVFASDVSASGELSRDVMTWLDGLAVDRSEVEMTDGVELDIGTVVGRFVSSEVGMLDIGTVLAIDTGEAVY